MGSVDPCLRRTDEAATMTDNLEGIVGAVGIVVFTLVFIAGLMIVMGIGD
jgi:hypothetical protein